MEPEWDGTTAEWHSGAGWVDNFASFALERAEDIRLYLGFTVKDSMTSCQILGMTLRSLGLKTISRRIGGRGSRVRVYHLDAESLDIVKRILARRSESHIEQGFLLRSHPLIKSLLEGLDTTLDLAIKKTAQKLPIIQAQIKRHEPPSQSIGSEGNTPNPTIEPGLWRFFSKGGSQNRTDDKDFADL